MLVSSPHHNSFTIHVAPLLAMLVLGSSCKRVDDPDHRVPVAAEGSNILLQVTSAEGEPIPLAHVTVDGRTLFADTAGFVQLDDLPVGRFNARIDADDFTSAAVVTTIADGASPFAGAHLLSHSLEESFDASVEATIEGAGIRVVLPPDSLVDHAGDPVTGMVDFGAVVLDPSQPGALDLLPSHLKAQAKSGESVMLRSLVMADISLEQDGIAVQLAPGELARVELELPPSVAGSVALGAKIPAWWLDLDTGSWVEEGMGTVEENEHGNKVWVVYVSHFSWWNCDLAVTASSLRCFSVSVEDANGTLIPDLKITVTDELPGTFKDGGTSYTVPNNQGGNCVVAELGTSEPTLNIGETDELLATANILTLLEAAEGPSTTLGGESGTCYTDGVEASMGTGDDRMPASLNASCTQVRVTLPLGFEQACTPGEVQLCPYPSEHASQLDLGICKSDRRYCINGGLTLTDCVGEVLPKAREDCRTLADDDCSGNSDDFDASDPSCTCSEGMVQCYTGPTSTQGVGACTIGARRCELVSEEWVFGACEDSTLPSTEDCTTTSVTTPSEDEDCDGDPTCTGRTRSTQDSTGVVLLDSATDSRGNLYALGYIDKGSVFAFDGSDTNQDPLPEHGEKSAFLVKLDANDRDDFDAAPRVEWTKIYPDTAAVAPKPTSGTGLALYEDDDGVAAIYIVGTFQGSMEGANEVLTNDAGLDDIFVARLDSAGNMEWMESFGGDSEVAPVPADLAVTEDGSTVYVTGYAYGKIADWTSAATIDIDEDAGDADAFVASIRSADGAQNWGHTYGSIDTDTSIGVAIGSRDGSLYISGLHQGSFDAGNGQVIEGESANPYVAKLDQTGRAQWITSIETFGGDVRGLAIDADDTVFVTGTVIKSIGGTSNNDIYVTAIGSDGTQGWFEDLNEGPDGVVSPGLERSEAIDIDARGNLVVTATIYSNSDTQSIFEGVPLSPMPTTSTFHVAVAKLLPSGVLVWATHPKLDGRPGLDGTVRSIAVSPNYGDIYVMGAGLFAELAP